MSKYKNELKNISDITDCYKQLILKGYDDLNFRENIINGILKNKKISKSNIKYFNDILLKIQKNKKLILELFKKVYHIKKEILNNLIE